MLQIGRNAGQVGSIQACICRYKSLSSQLYVLSLIWLYFNKALIFFKICTYISMYLFHIDLLVHIGDIAQFQVKQVYQQWLCIKLAPSSAGISFMTQLFGIELAYSHNVLFRLFVGLMEINPVFLLISLCISLVLGILSFYYEYSYLF